MESLKYTYLVFGATGRTGRHFVSIALHNGNKVRALTRHPEKIDIKNPNLELVKGSIIDFDKMDELLQGVDFIICMLGDAQLQKSENINTAFIKKLIPAMRRQKVKHFLYQAGGFTKPYKENLPLLTSILKNTIARYFGLLGQHRDNEAVIEYLVEEAQDIQWVVHRASLTSDGASKGILQRSKTKNSLATFIDGAEYNYRIVTDNSAIHTCDLSYYAK